MDQSLKDKLPKLTLENLHHLDGGKIRNQFVRAVNRAFQNISEFPCKGDKAESREINLVIQLTPVIKFSRRPIENAYGQSEATFPEIVGVTVTARIKDKFPIYQSDDVLMAVDIVNGHIQDARFNPNNNNSPAQLELDLGPEA